MSPLAAAAAREVDEGGDTMALSSEVALAMQWRQHKSEIKSNWGIGMALGGCCDATRRVRGPLVTKEPIACNRGETMSGQGGDMVIGDELHN